MRRRKIRRKTHICPNCETLLEREENYCHVCGQENHNLNVPMKDLVMEVIGSFTFFETKFIETAKIIFTHPGKLTLDFNSGKRVKYMHPVRMYFWVSAIFFLVVSLTSSGPKVKIRKADVSASTPDNKEKDSTNRKSQKPIDTDTNRILLGQLAYEKLEIHKDSLEYYYKLNDDELDSVFTTKKISTFYTNKRIIKNDIEKQYDSYLNKKYGVAQQKSVSDNMLDIFPNLVFLMLPIAALILFFFERHTKWKFYFQHLVFTLNTHSAIFIMWTVLILISKGLKKVSSESIQDYIGDSLQIITLTIPLIYFLISLKKVYQQNWWKTGVKFLILTFCYFSVFFAIIVAGLFSGIIRM
jgi:hypothetical protein